VAVEAVVVVRVVVVVVVVVVQPVDTRSIGAVAVADHEHHKIRCKDR
jgi:hypothetical protein